MTPVTTTACPKCRKPIESGSKFCASCGNDISGVWSQNPALGGTIAVEVDPNVDVLGQMLGEATLGDYDIYGELGRGGMAAVYLGLDLSLNRKVAIKTMLPELVSKEGMVPRFKREAQTSAALSHPHIIQIFTVKQTEKLVFFVMKFIEGRSLESVITDKGKVPLSMTQTILTQVGSALDYAHRKHVVHRDIKPANIMIDEDGWAIVTDFGIAKVQEAQNLTATGTAIGTPHYMSPEQFHNKAVTGASDQYSLGVVLYEMLAGKKPFDGGTYAEIITQHLFEAPPDIREANPEMPEHVNEVIKKMMAKVPAERYPDLDTAIHALGAPASKKEGDVVRTQMISLAKSGPQKKLRMSVPMSPIPATKKRAAPSPTAIEPKRAPKKSGAGKWIGIAATLLALTGGGGYYYLNFMVPKQAPPTPAEQLADNNATQPVTPDSQAVTPATGETTPPAVTPATDPASSAQDELKRFRDSVYTADLQRVRDSVANARKVAAANRAAAKAAALETKAAPAAILQAQPAPQAPVVAQTAEVRIGSRTPGAALYVNGGVEGSLTSPKYYTVPAGTVRIEVRGAAAGCTPYDTTFQIAPGAQVTVGMRGPTCK